MASSAAHLFDPPVVVVDRRFLSHVDCASVTATDSATVHLGPLDLLVAPFIPVAVVYAFHQPTYDSTHLIPLTRLREALSSLLREYPHLTGRLHISDRTREVRHLGRGMEVLEATCSARLDAAFSSSDTGDTPRLHILDLPDGGNALLAPFDSSLEAVCRNPVFTVQHTRFACGSVTLGVRVLHTVCDADGFFQLMQDLFELYRGIRLSEEAGQNSSSAHLSQPPHIQSFLAHPDPMSEEEKRAALQLKPSLFQLATTSFEDGAAPVTASPLTAPTGPQLIPDPVVGRVLRFSAGELHALKAHASDPSSGGWVSTFDALAAHLYQRVHVARAQSMREKGLEPSALSTDFLTPINCRGADRLNLPPRYFPNALICTYFTLPAEKLATAPLSTIAKAVHDSVRQLGQQEVIDTVRWLRAQPDPSRITQGFRYENGGFMISQWSRFPMYSSSALDVDEQDRPIPPILVSTPFTPISLLDGLAYILPTEDQWIEASAEGAATKTCPASSSASSSFGSPNVGHSLDLNLALSEPLWTILDRDPLFRPFREHSERGEVRSGTS